MGSMTMVTLGGMSNSNWKASPPNSGGRVSSKSICITSTPHIKAARHDAKNVLSKVPQR